MTSPSLRKKLSPTVRVGLSVFVVLVTLVALPVGERQAVRFLTAFNFGGWSFLVLLAVVATGADPSEVRARSRDTNRGRGRVIIGVLLACLSSLIAVGVVLRAAGGNRTAFRAELGLSSVTVFTAWLLLQSVFAMYYARCYYQPSTTSGSADGDEGGIQFAGTELPDYWDFVYFSFTIGTCYATSDTPITSRVFRRAALLQMFVSFLFYTFLVGMVINAIGALLQP